MFKIIKGRSLIIPFVLISMLFVFGFSSFNFSDGPEVTLENALNAAKEQDVDSYLSYIYDEDFKDDLEEQRKAYSELLEKDELNSFKIIDFNKLSETEYKATVELTFEHNEIIETEFLMQDFDGEWKLVIRDKSAEQVKVIQKGDNYSLNDDDNSLNAGISVCNWNFRYRQGQHIWSNCKFTPRGQSFILSISEQYVDPISAPPTPAGIRITYDVAYKSWFGATVYGTTTVRGNYASGLYSLNINSDGVGKTGVQMRFYPTTDSDSWRVYMIGRGTLYY